MREEAVAVVDREARDRLSHAIRNYLEDEITAFEFDTRLDEICNASKDPTVHVVRSQLWYHYDDIKDHKAVLSREQWNFFQRLLLLIGSGLHMSIEHGRVWHWRQLVAAMALACYIVLAVRLGWGEQLWIISLPFGLISIALSRFYPSDTKAIDPALVPFATLAQMERVYRSVLDFRKQPYRRDIAGRAIRTPAGENFVRIQQILAWLLLSPLALFWQCLPGSRMRIELDQLPSHSAGCQVGSSAKHAR